MSKSSESVVELCLWRVLEKAKKGQEATITDTFQK